MKEVAQTYVYNTTDVRLLSYQELHDQSVSGELESLTKEVRKHKGDPKKQKKLKKGFPMHSYSSHFSQYGNEFVTASTGDYAFDVDIMKGVDEAKAIEEVENQFKLVATGELGKYTIRAWRSSRFGFSFVAQTDYKTTNPEEHSFMYNYALSRFRKVFEQYNLAKYSYLDVSCNSLTSGQYNNDDKNAYINLSAKKFTFKQNDFEEYKKSQQLKASKDANQYQSHLMLHQVFDFFQNNIDKLQIGENNYVNSRNLMYALTDTFDEQIAKQYCIKFFQMKGIYDAKIFDGHWRSDRSDRSRKITFGHLLKMAKDAGFEYHNKDASLFSDAIAQSNMLVKNNDDDTIFVDYKLSEKDELIRKHLLPNTSIVFDASTKLGKTYYITNILSRFFKILYVSFTNPLTISITKEDGLEVPHICSDTDFNPEQLKKIDYNLIAVTIDSLLKVLPHINASEYIIVLDESSNLINSYNYKADAIVNYIKNKGLFRNEILLSGTIADKNLFGSIVDFADTTYLKFRPTNQEAINFQPIISTDPIKTLAKYAMEDMADGNITAIYCNNKKKIIKIIDAIGKEKKPLEIHAESKIGYGYKHLISKEEVEKSFDYFIATCLILEGLNILNTNIVNIHVYGLECSWEMLQFQARFRLKNVNIIAHIPESGYNLINFSAVQIKEYFLGKTKDLKSDIESWVHRYKLKNNSDAPSYDNTKDYLKLLSKNKKHQDNPYYYHDDTEELKLEPVAVAHYINERMMKQQRENPFLFAEEAYTKYGFDILEPVFEEIPKEKQTSDTDVRKSVVKTVANRYQSHNDASQLYTEISDIINVQHFFPNETRREQQAILDLKSLVDEFEQRKFSKEQAFTALLNGKKTIAKIKKEYFDRLDFLHGYIDGNFKTCFIIAKDYMTIRNDVKIDGHYTVDELKQVLANCELPNIKLTVITKYFKLDSKKKKGKKGKIVTGLQLPPELPTNDLMLLLKYHLVKIGEEFSFPVAA